MIAHGPRDRPLVALTFDDGPGEDTPALLEALARERLAATFFLHGEAVRRHPGVVRRVRNLGHEPANHALRHERLEGRPLQALREVAACQRLVARACGVRPRVWRPPYGSASRSVLLAVRPLGVRAVGWDVDPEDWTRPGARAIADRVLATVRPGSIVDLHDGRGLREQTVAAIPAIAAGLRSRGLQAVTVSALLAG